jgi:predicted enzyme related to lactoylglutathione lyase
MKKVIGIGGVFFKAKDPKAMAQWYQTHLGIDFDGKIYCDFEFSTEEKGSMAFSFFEPQTKYFEPSEKEFMINFRVENLDALLKTLREEGVEIVGEPQAYDYGKFGWILDPEGNKIELWQPSE